MKKKTTLLLALTMLMYLPEVFSQIQYEAISGSIKRGTRSKSLIVSLLSNRNFSGSFSNLQFCLQIPDSNMEPALKIISNPLGRYLPTENYVISTTHEDGFYNFLFTNVTFTSPLFHFREGIKSDVLEISFSGDGDAIDHCRLAHLPDGGIVNHQMTFYVEVDGKDNTCYHQLFYGEGASNQKNYKSYSYVGLPCGESKNYFLLTASN